MQVTSANDQVTHAVITNRAARGFTVSDSAEFIHVLSDTLYSNKPLAVVREVLCNAWDIHIVTKRENIAVKVTLNDQELIIQDFGTGIHDDDIHDIYCGYGNSTKKNDGTQTGGFGLGSKAPFAYADTIEVTSCHNGIKTIYRASKSMAELDGRPGMVPMVSIPTTESGLTVKIPLNEPHDRLVFSDLIKTIARNGEMNVELNGTVLDVYPFSKAQYNWLIINKTERYGSSIHIRYGNVIYPIENHDQYRAMFDSITEFFRKLPDGDMLSIVFMAKPNTISVTPSRESLSMAKRTVDTLTELLEEFHFDFNKDLEEQCKQALILNMIKQYGSGNLKEFFLDNKLIMNGVTKPSHYIRDEGLRQGDFITNTRQITNYFLKKNYPTFTGFHKFDLGARLDMLIANKFGDTTLLKKYKKLWLQSYHRSFRMSSVFFYKEILWPLRKAGLADPLVDKLKLQVLESTGDRYYHGDRQKLTDVEKLRFKRVHDFLPYLRKIVVLTHRTSDYEERAKAFTDVFGKLGTVRDLLVCTVPRSKGRPEAYKALFQSQGYEIIDLTIVHPWEKLELEEKAVVAATKEKVPEKPKGILQLKAVVDNQGYTTQRQTVWNGLDPAKKVLKPRAVLIMTRSNNPVSSAELRFLREFYGQEIGICVSTTQRDKYIKEGAMDFYDFIESEFLYYLQNHNSILSYLHYHPNYFQQISAGPFQAIVKAALAYYPLAKSLGIASYLTKKDKQWLDFWNTYLRFNKFCDKDKLARRKQIEAILKAPPVPPELTALSERIQKSRTIRFIDVSEVKHTVTGAIRHDYLTKLIGVRLLVTALKG